MEFEFRENRGERNEELLHKSDIKITIHAG